MKINLISERDLSVTPAKQVLVNRGIDKDKVEEFLNTNDSHINDFELLDNITEATEKLIEHYKKGSNIMIQQDADADGATSAAMLYNYLLFNFPDIKLFYQVHDEKYHELYESEDVKSGKYQLIFVPDAGSFEYEKHKRLKEQGIDIIVLDHHEGERYSDHAIVVNNLLSQRYPNKNISGAGVVYQYLRALDKHSPNDIHRRITTADDYLDLAAVGIVADMMDLRELETKRVVEKGIERIKNISKYNNSFLMGLFEKQSYSLRGVVTPFKISFYIAPMINAIMRAGTYEERVLLFEAMLEDKAHLELPSTKRGAKPGDTETYVEKALRTVTNVRNRQKNMRDEAFNKFDSEITEEYLKNNSVIVVKTNNELDKNLNGLVANQLMAKYQRPVFVLGENEKGYAGSARNYECDLMMDFKDFVENSSFAEYAAGHQGAFGVSFTEENLEKFLEYSRQELKYDNFEKTYAVDFIFETKELDPKEILEIASLNKYWGKGIPEALIYIKGVEIRNDQKTLMSPDKNPTLKLNVGGIDAIKFKSGFEELESIAPHENTVTVMNIIATCQINDYRGKVSPQLFIEGYEIIDTLESYIF